MVMKTTVIAAIFFFISAINCVPRRRRHEDSLKILNYSEAKERFENFLAYPEPPLVLIHTKEHVSNAIEVKPRGIVLRRCPETVIFNEMFECKAIASRTVNIEIHTLTIERQNEIIVIHPKEHTKCKCISAKTDYDYQNQLV